MVSCRIPPGVLTSSASPRLCPRSALPTGDSMEMSPWATSASADPTMVYSSSAPSASFTRKDERSSRRSPTAWWTCLSSCSTLLPSSLGLAFVVLPCMTISWWPRPEDHRRAIRPSTALALLDEAQAAAGSQAPLFLCTWISARQAEEHAATGDARTSHQDLSRAERTLGAARTPGGGAFSPWDEARLAGFRGSCALLLGWPRQAVIALEGALVGTSASLLSPRSAVLTDCAAAYARQQELEKACALLTDSLTIAGQAGLRPYVQRILGVRQRLAFCAASPAMRQLDER